jgi:hypothetical protein
MPEQPKWGTVNLGVDVISGHGEKIEYDPARGQELNIPPDAFRVRKGSDYNPYGVNSQMRKGSLHERIKELLGEGWPRKQAIIQAKQEAEEGNYGDVGTVAAKEVYRAKYQAEEPSKKISPYSSQIQGYPFI